MQSNFNKILTIFLAIIIFGSGGMFYFQQKSINELKNKIYRKNKASANIAPLPDINTTPPPSIAGNTETNGTSTPKASAAEALKKSYLENPATLFGIIKSVSDDSFVVEARVIDLDRLEGFDFSKKEPLPSILRDYKIMTNESTAYQAIKFSDLKAGDGVVITPKESYYKDNGNNPVIAISVALNKK